MFEPRSILFGDDVFISYSRLDGTTYGVGLANRLTERGFTCRIDQWGTEPGAEIPLSTLVALRRSAMLIIVATRGAGASEQVEKEIRAFLPTGRHIIAIDLDDSIQKSRWWRLIYGLPISKDSFQHEGTKSAKHTGEPSSEVLSRIEKTFGYGKKNDRLRRATGCMMSMLIILLAACALLIEASHSVRNTIRRDVDTSFKVLQLTLVLQKVQADLEATKAAQQQAQRDLALAQERIAEAEEKCKWLKVERITPSDRGDGNRPIVRFRR